MKIKNTCIACILLFALAIHQLDAIPPASKAVSNEDIRDAILSIVHMMRGLEDKLDRHEFRERATAQDWKKNFATLEKRIKTLDSMKGTTQRLDERVANVETILMTQDTKFQGVVDVVQELRKSLPNELYELQKQLSDKLSNLSRSSIKIEHGLDKLAKDSDAMKKTNAASNENIERTKKQLSDSELLLQQYEHKLIEFNDKIQTEIVPIEYKDNSGISKAIQENKELLERANNELSMLSQKVMELPQRNELQSFANDTANNLTRLAQLAAHQGDAVEKKLSEVQEALSKGQDVMLHSMNELGEIGDNLTRNMADGLDGLKRDVSTLPKLEELLLQTAAGLLDTKRRVEYSVHALKLEMNLLIKEHGDKMNDTINDRFDTFELNILDGETGALANLTSKIGQEIDQVWRQIGNMHQQMSASTDTLNKLQNQTDTYVSGSLNVMDSMKGKVSQITSRMAEVDENLNYLIGRLSLFTQEFNRIKTGLGEAIDEIRSSFISAKSRISDMERNATAVDKGPGPHKIDTSDY